MGLKPTQKEIKVRKLFLDQQNFELDERTLEPPTLYLNFMSFPVVEYVLMDLLLQNATLCVETKSKPAIAPVVVYK